MQPCHTPRTNVGRSAASAFLTYAALLLALSPVEAKPPVLPTAREALQSYTRQRAFPRKSINYAAYDVARAQAARMPGITASDLHRGAKTAHGVTASLGWTFIGPTNMTGPGPFGYGPEIANGRVNAAAYDPLNTNILYLAAPSGGIWKSMDGGTTWATNTDHLHAGIGFSSIVVDPVNDQILYAGSGDYDGSDALGFGLWKSTDGATTWKRIDIGAANRGIFGNHCIRKVVIDPKDHTHIIVGLGRDQSYLDLLGGTPLPNGYIFSSHDSGATWTKALAVPGFVDNIVVNSNNTTYYASVDYVGVYKSTDGDHWTQLKSINAGVTLPLQGYTYRLDVAASVLDPNTLYVLSEAAHKVYKSTDGGVTFHDSTNNLPANFTFNNLSTWSQGFYDFYITTSKATLSTTGQTKEVVYIGLLDIYQSVDGATTWASIARVYTGNDETHTDQHAGVVNPKNPNELLMCNDGGIYRFNYVPETNTWTFTSLNGQLGITQMYSSAYSPIDSTDVIGGCQDNSQPVTRIGPGAGNLQMWLNPVGGDGGFANISGVGPNPQDHINGIPFGTYATRYVSSQFGSIYQTDDLWDSFLTITPAFGATEPIEFIAPIQISQASANDLYVGSNYLYHYVHVDPTWMCMAMPPTWKMNAGTWTKSANSLGLTATDDITAISPSPTNQGVIYVGTLQGGLWVSGTAGTDTANGKFTRIDNQSNPGGLPARTITHVEISPLNTQRVYVTVSGTGSQHVFRCDDVTATPPIWIPVSGNATHPLPDVPTNWITLIPHDDEQEWWIATDIGVFVTTDGGQTYHQNESLGLPGVPVKELTFVPSTGNIEAATYGRGMWRLNIGNDVPFQFFPRLPYYIGDKTLITMNLKFYHANQPVITDPRLPKPGNCIDWDPFRLVTPPTEIRNGGLSPAGWLTTNLSSIGDYDVYVQIPYYLRKRVHHVLTGDKPIVSDQLYAGDVVSYDPASKTYLPPDNAIDGYDVLLVLGAITSSDVYQNSIYDLNGDGLVDGNDLAIVTRNSGRVGD